MSDPTKFQDVHKFDGKIPHFISTRFDKDYKKKSFDKFYGFEEFKQQPHMIPAFRSITENVGSPQNYDPSNKYYVDDILIEILEILENNKDVDSIFLKFLIFEQMNDMIRLGPCIQGRAHRLFQIYNAIKFSSDIIQFFPEFKGNTIELEYRILLL